MYVIHYSRDSSNDASVTLALGIQLTAGASTLEALVDVKVKDLQWALKAPAREAQKLLAAAKQQISALTADGYEAKQVEEAAIRGNLGLKI